MQQIGHLYESGQLGVESEHVASRGIAQALGSLGTDQSAKRPALLTAAPEEQHVLALLALRTHLTSLAEALATLS